MVHTKSSISEKLDRLIRFSFYALIFFLPISIALVETFSGFILFFFLIKRILTVRHLKPTPTFLSKPLLFFVLATLISVLFSQYHKLSVVAFIGKTLQGVFIFTAFLEAFTEERHISKFLSFWICSALLTCLSGLSQFFFNFEFLRGNEISGGRVSSSLRHANDFGAYIITICPLIFVFLFNWKVAKTYLIKFTKQPILQSPLLWGTLLTVVFLVMVICLGLTMSRASWIAFFAAIVLAGLYRKKRFLFIFLMIMGFVVIFTPVMIKNRDVSLITDNVREQREAFSKIENVQPIDLEHIHSGHDLFEDLVANGYVGKDGVILQKFWLLKYPSEFKLKTHLDESQKQELFDVLNNSKYWHRFLNYTVQRLGQGRLNFWKEALGVIYDYPVFGAGLNTYSQIAPKYRITWGGYPHNSYLQTTAELGFVGLGCMLWMLWVLFKNSFKRIKQMPASFSRCILIGTLAGFFAYLIQSFFDTTFYSVQLSTFFWLMMALAVAVGRVDKTPSPAKIHQ
jgi:O-antigen ligase